MTTTRPFTRRVSRTPVSGLIQAMRAEAPPGSVRTKRRTRSADARPRTFVSVRDSDVVLSAP